MNAPHIPNHPAPSTLNRYSESDEDGKVVVTVEISPHRRRPLEPGEKPFWLKLFEEDFLFLVELGGRFVQAHRYPALMVTDDEGKASPHYVRRLLAVHKLNQAYDAGEIKRRPSSKGMRVVLIDRDGLPSKDHWDLTQRLRIDRAADTHSRSGWKASALLRGLELRDHQDTGEDEDPSEPPRSGEES